jgi:Tfp pilus assembly protein PilZ
MSTPERRHHRRRACLIPAKEVGQSRPYEEFILDISSAGVFIETRRPVCRDQEIEVTFIHPGSLKDITVVGRVVWLGEKGFGMRFKRLVRKQEDENSGQLRKDRIEERQHMEEEEKKVGKIRQKKILWQASPTPGINRYKLYWSTDGILDYSSPSLEVGSSNDIVLPEGAPSFPLVNGKLTLGISAINDAGNESDITQVKAEVNFVVPDAPRNLRIEDL